MAVKSGGLVLNQDGSHRAIPLNFLITEKKLKDESYLAADQLQIQGYLWISEERN